MATATTAQQSRTRAQLRQAVGELLGDLIQITATANGTTTTTIDTLNVGSAEDHFNGRYLMATSGANAGEVKRITATATSTGTLTHGAFSTATAAGDTFDVTNARGRGFRPDEYHAAINELIVEAWPAFAIHVEDGAGTFDADTEDITVDAALAAVYEVEWTDSQGTEHRIRGSNASQRDGWIADPANGKIKIVGSAKLEPDGNTVTLKGYGRQDTLSAEADTCLIPAAWLVPAAALRLATRGLTRDPDRYGPLLGVLQRRVDQHFPLIATTRAPGWKSVRSA
ncbi:MAG: hypothetical protein C4523_19620 [Myxococcales bacterium]|nr:MAG: hypothetical protein C4523_19620 [Myxococcales bacterium]